MAFLFPEAQTDTNLATKTQLVQLTNNTGTLLAAYVNSTLVLAFNVRLLHLRLDGLQTSDGCVILLAIGMLSASCCNDFMHATSDYFTVYV